MLQALEEAAELGVELLGRCGRYSCHGGSAVVLSFQSGGDSDSLGVVERW